MNIHELYDKRAAIWAQMEEIADRAESGELSAEDAEQYDRLEAEFERLSGQIQRAERHGQRAEELAAVRIETRVLPGGDRVVERQVNPIATEEYRAAWLAWLRAGASELSPEQRAVLRQGYVREERAQATTPGASGGFLIPEVYRVELIRAMSAFGGVRQVARVLTTADGATLYVPTVDDTTNKGRLLAESTAVTTTDVAFGQKQLDAYKYSSDQVLVPFELLQDSMFDLNALIFSLLSERLGRITEEHYTTGTGSGQPNGVVTASSLGVTGANGQTTSVTADDLIDLFHAVDPAYRAGAVWMMSDATAKAVRKLKDGDGQYLWQPGLQAGEPDRLLGRAVVINQEMPDMAASAKSILFGDFSLFWIRDVADVRLIRLNERYADVDQVGFFAFLRTDSELIGPSAAIKHYANSAT